MAWLWILLALLAVLLLWWVLDDDGEEAAIAPAAVVAPVTPVAPAAGVAPAAPGIGETAGTPGGPITTIEAILSASDPRALVGQQVRLDQVQVQSVPADRLFMVGPAADRTVMVRTTPEPSPGTPVEGQVNVNPGQVVSLTGTLQSGPVDGANPSGSAGMPTGQDVYIRADNINIVQAAQ